MVRNNITKCSGFCIAGTNVSIIDIIVLIKYYYSFSLHGARQLGNALKPVERRNWDPTDQLFSCGAHLRDETDGGIYQLTSARIFISLEFTV